MNRAVAAATALSRRAGTASNTTASTVAQTALIINNVPVTGIYR
ncbi:MAG TPA: hypothetical protein VN327_08215 [Pseudonocardiaceae bacterium]|nr:hypothetical protein [Pseudonocardiaceae bacterium]